MADGPGIKMINPTCQECGTQMRMEFDRGNIYIRCMVCHRIYYFTDKNIFDMVGIKLLMEHTSKQKSATQTILDSMKNMKMKEEVKLDYEWEEFVKMAIDS